jgi:hypothetical protein
LAPFPQDLGLVRELLGGRPDLFVGLSLLGVVIPVLDDLAAAGLPDVVVAIVVIVVLLFLFALVVGQRISVLVEPLELIQGWIGWEKCEGSRHRPLAKAALDPKAE